MTPEQQQIILVAIIAALPGLLVGVVSLWVAIKKNPHEIEKTDAEKNKTKAETNLIHQQVADRWAEHVEELAQKVELLETGRTEDKKVIEKRAEHEEELVKKVELLEAARAEDKLAIEKLQLDINQVRRENESYRIEASERDAIIEALQDWGARLTKQVVTHLPHIDPEKYYRRRNDA